MLRIKAKGNVGADPELHEMDNGNRWCKLSVASSKKIKDKFQTTWFEFRFWNVSCDWVVENIRKGDRVSIDDAELTCYKYTDDTGKERSMWYGSNGFIEKIAKPSEPRTPYEEFEREEWF